MQKLKKLLAVLVCAAMTLVAAPCLTVGAATAKDGLTYTEYDDHITVTGYTGSSDKLVISDVIKGKPVTTIDPYAFFECTSLKSVTISNNVTKIGDYAFSSCTGLTEVKIGSGIKQISWGAFAGCDALTYFNIPNNVTEILSYAFANCSALTSINIPSSVTYLGGWVFEGCANLVSVTIPDSVTHIGYSAFDGTALYNDDGNWGNGILYIDNHLIKARANEVSGAYAIRPDTITVSDIAFEECTGLTEVSIPSSVKYVGSKAFSKCTRLLKIELDGENENYDCYDGALFNKQMTKLMQYPCGNIRTSYIIPSSVKEIDSSAFYGCANIKSVTIPNGVTIINYDTFRECTGLKSISVPLSVTKIDMSAFDSCASIADVYYAGSAEDWKRIDIGICNDNFTNANIHYNSDGPSEDEDMDEIAETIAGPLKYYGAQTLEMNLPTHMFKNTYEESVAISFDLKINAFSDGVIAFSSNKTVFGDEAIAIHTNGSFIARNGDGKGGATNESFFKPTLGETYHFEITTDTKLHTWSAKMTAPDGQMVIAAKDYGYRTNQDKIDRIILLVNKSKLEYLDDVELTNLTISSTPGNYAIASIDVPTKTYTVNNGGILPFPKQFNATLETGEKIPVNVTWDISMLNGPGEYTVYGAVKGYDEKIPVNVIVNDTKWLLKESLDDNLKYYCSQYSDKKQHMFKNIYSGEIRIEFDLKINKLSDGAIIFTNQSEIYGPEAFLIQTNGPLISRDGDGSGNAELNKFYSPTLGQTYHFTLITDMAAHLWSGIMTTPNGEAVSVAENYGYRTNQDSIDRIILVKNTNEEKFVDDVEVINLKIYQAINSSDPIIEVDEIKQTETGTLVSISAVNIPNWARIYVASYDDKGVRISLTKAAVIGGRTLLTVPDDSKKIKVFYWESLNSMRPLCPVKEVAVVK